MDASPLHDCGEVPELIRTKYQLFLEQEKTIRRLEDELKDLQDQHSQLDKELDPYRPSINRENQRTRSKNWQITYLRDRSPIHACPEEVLTEIFQSFLATRHYQIRILLLVCKTWYDIIMSNPKLWARIQTPTFDEPFQDEALSIVFDDITIPYIRACLERSRDLPLDIEVSLYWMPSFHDYIVRHAYPPLEDIVDMSTFENGLWTIQWPETYFSYKYRFFDLLQNDVERWRHLSITLPDGNDEAGAVIRSLPLNKANLRSLELINIESPRIRSWDNAKTNLLPDLSGIKRLNSGMIPLSNFTGSPSCLVELNIIARQLTDIQEISSCSRLQSLTLEIRNPNLKPVSSRITSNSSDDEDDSDESTIISEELLLHLRLSSLKNLTLVGCFGPLSLFGFDTPALDYLEIYPRVQRWRPGGPYEIIRMPELPKVLVRRIHWRMPSWEEDGFIYGLDCVLSQLREAEMTKISIPVGYSSSLAILFKMHAANKLVIVKSQVAGKWNPKELDAALACLQKWADNNGYSFETRQDLDIDHEFLRRSNTMELL